MNSTNEKVLNNQDEFDLTPGEIIVTPPTIIAPPFIPGPIPSAAPPAPPIMTTPESVNKYGLTDEEVRDPNKINISVSDPSPVVILFGAKTSGKTMALVRLTRYLKQIGYYVKPDEIFRPGNSTHYKKMCNTFNEMVVSSIAPSGTDTLSFMLIKICDKNGTPICQVLEAPGEHYFDEIHNQPFPTYIQQITSYRNSKTWIFIVEDDWKDESVRQKYAQKIQEMEAIIKHDDKIVFMCHKADKKVEYIHRGIPNEKLFFRDILNQYRGVFSRYENKNPITSVVKRYNFDFVVFSAGTFTTNLDNSQTYIPSEDRYPKILWETILRTVKGGW